MLLIVWFLNMASNYTFQLSWLAFTGSTFIYQHYDTLIFELPFCNLERVKLYNCSPILCIKWCSSAFSQLLWFSNSIMMLYCYYSMEFLITSLLYPYTSRNKLRKLGGSAMLKLSSWIWRMIIVTRKLSRGTGKGKWNQVNWISWSRFELITMFDLNIICQVIS